MHQSNICFQCGFTISINQVIKCKLYVDAMYIVRRLLLQNIDHLSFERDQDGSKSWLIASGISRFRRDVRLPFVECNIAVNSREIASRLDKTQNIVVW